ncbi:MAG TPA: light-harvesting antenna LH1, alpha subunit [Pseudomonadales bacterium]|nr:light-harvesting antenna LH1, alpha subunit [Pseudomonadales bacterium]
MWRIWLMFDPARIMVAMAIFLFALAIVIHFILLSTDRFNWLDGPSTAVITPAAQMVPLHADNSAVV